MRCKLASLLCLIALFFALCAAPLHAETVLTVFAQGYTPEVSTGDNPKPLHEMTRLAREFERLHPGVRIRFIKNPVGEYRTWMRTQLQGGLAPDVMWAHSTWCNDDAKYGWFVNLDPYLAKPNPYCAPEARGAKRWGDLFYADATNAKRAPDGHLYALPIDQVETAIYYNKDLFRQAGVQPPNTWAEFIALQKRLKKRGVLPFLMTAQLEMRLSWAQAILNDQLWGDKMPMMDVRATGSAGFAGVDEQEFIRAYKKGIFSLQDPRYREKLRLLKEWSQYWAPGALAANDDRLFRLGKVAMWWDGSWYAPQIERDPMRAFEYGVFLVPRLTKESSPYASNVGARGVGGATSIQYAVTNTAIAGGRIELAIDFLRFITAPAQLGPLVSEAGLFLPNVVGLAGSPLLKPFQKVLEVGHVRFGGEQGGSAYAEQGFRILQGFLGGQFDEEETIKRQARYLAKGVEDELKINATVWRFDKNWEILPNAIVSHAPPTPAKKPWGLLIAALGTLFCLIGGVLLIPKARRALWRHRVPYLFLTPSFALLILFSYYPIASAIGHSFTEWKGSGEATFVGLANFKELFRDDILRESIGNMVKMLVAGIVISLTVPLAVAELIFALRSSRAQYLYRVLFVVPMVVPGVVILLIWGFIYDNNLGLLNQALDLLGIGGLKHAWLGEPGLVLYSLVFIGFPWVGGFGLLIYYAGLQNIPHDIFDSSKIDGVTGFARFRFIDLPLLMGQIKLLVVLGVIGGLQGFQTQLLLSNGGPGYATMVPGMHMYQNAMTFDRMGYACAIGVALFLVILLLTYINMKYLRSSTEYQP
ncbi:MAG: extracellular solute-binding protein [Armatimonadetes bacterium]|nr:extracellular solute-binding protein [Armatimonadota bacterium]